MPPLTPLNTLLSFSMPRYARLLLLFADASFMMPAITPLPMSLAVTRGAREYSPAMPPRRR